MTNVAQLLEAPLIDLLTGAIIQMGTNGDAAKLVGRANELISINSAMTKINNGDQSGITDLQAALNTTSLSPGEGLALQSLLATIAKQVAAIQAVVGSTLLGTVNTTIMNGILSVATACAQAYVAKYSPPAK